MLGAADRPPKEDLTMPLMSAQRSGDGVGEAGRGASLEFKASHETTPNARLSEALRRVAELLRSLDASPHRVRAYLRAAERVANLDRSVAQILRSEGIKGLEALPDIGRSIAALIVQYVQTGRITLLERLEGTSSPEALFASVPGIGPVLAARIHAELDIETLEDLEIAAHDGTLERLPGMGLRRVHAIRASLADILSRSRRWGVPSRGPRPGVALLLEIDQEYRRRAAQGKLRKIAPRRFNAGGKAWLPLLHLDRGGWSFTAMFSNTALAHRLGRTLDWVVIYYERDGFEGQCTVVTERSGAQRGNRVVRGRESECLRLRSGPGHEGISDTQLN